MLDSTCLLVSSRAQPVWFYSYCMSILQIHIALVQNYWMGKPDPVIYDVALDMLNIPKEHILAVGDSLQHDIQGWAHDSFNQHCLACSWCHTLRQWAFLVAGACNADVDSLFITGGIHAKDLAASDGELDTQKMLQLFRKHKGQPTYTMPVLQI